MVASTGNQTAAMGNTRDPGVGGVPGGVQGRGTTGSISGGGQSIGTGGSHPASGGAPGTTGGGKSDPGVGGVPGGLEGRGTTGGVGGNLGGKGDIGVGGVPGGVEGRGTTGGGKGLGGLSAGIGAGEGVSKAGLGGSHPASGLSGPGGISPPSRSSLDPTRPHSMAEVEARRLSGVPSLSAQLGKISAPPAPDTAMGFQGLTGVTPRSTAPREPGDRPGRYADILDRGSPVAVGAPAGAQPVQGGITGVPSTRNYPGYSSPSDAQDVGLAGYLAGVVGPTPGYAPGALSATPALPAMPSQRARVANQLDQGAIFDPSTQAFNNFEIGLPSQDLPAMTAANLPPKAITDRLAQLPPKTITDRLPVAEPSWTVAPGASYTLDQPLTAPPGTPADMSSWTVAPGATPPPDVPPGLAAQLAMRAPPTAPSRKITDRLPQASLEELAAGGAPRSPMASQGVSGANPSTIGPFEDLGVERLANYPTPAELGAQLAMRAPPRPAPQIAQKDQSRLSGAFFGGPTFTPAPQTTADLPSQNVPDLPEPQPFTDQPPPARNPATPRQMVRQFTTGKLPMQQRGHPYGVVDPITGKILTAIGGFMPGGLPYGVVNWAFGKGTAAKNRGEIGNKSNLPGGQLAYSTPGRDHPEAYQGGHGNEAVASVWNKKFADALQRGANPQQAAQIADYTTTEIFF